MVGTMAIGREVLTSGALRTIRIGKEFPGRQSRLVVPCKSNVEPRSPWRASNNMVMDVDHERSGHIYHNVYLQRGGIT